MSVNRIEQMQKVQKEGLELFKKKNKDYGDAFAKYGTVGVLIRMEDKLQRSISISNSGINLVDNESMRDTLLDLHNYAAMALMLMDE
jgi:DNA-binding protein YbaB